MLPVTHRLRQKQDFQRVFRRGRLVRGRTLFLKICLSARVKTRIGIVVSNKIAAKAVARNLLKRRLRAAFLGLLPEIKDGFDLVAVGGPRLKQATVRGLKQEIWSLLRQNNLIKIDRRLK